MGIRTFIAVEIPSNLKEELSSLQQELAKAGADIKWVESVNMHISLKFLGDTEEKTVATIKETLTRIAGENYSFNSSLAGIGVFPRIDSPRVIWVGMEEGKNAIVRLAECIDRELACLGFMREKRHFSAHLTLGRIRSTKNKDRLKKLIGEMETLRLRNAFSIDKIIFFRSELTSPAPIYTKLAEFKLRTERLN